jgi:polar amino acid transport system substrate-binding protein
MKSKKNLFALLLACLLLAVTLAGCTTQPAETTDPDEPSGEATEPTVAPADTDSDLAYIMDKGTLVIGITAYAPMNYYDENGKLIGFDTEFAEALCAELGLTPEFIIIDWDSKELELKSKKIDCIWNGLTIKEDRRENMDFTTAYLMNEQVVVIRAEDAALYTDLSSFSGVSVVAEVGSAGEDTVYTDMPDAVFTGVTAQSDALLEVKAGTADAAVIDYTMATAMTGEGTDYSELMIVEGIDLMDEEYAIGFRLGSDMTAKANEIIEKFLADGTLSELAEKYEMSDLLITD